MGVKTLRTWTAGVLGVIAAGALIYAAAPHAISSGYGKKQSVVTGLGGPSAAPVPEKTFFQGMAGQKVGIVLAADPMVQKSMPDVPSSQERVEVFLPVYPGAKQVTEHPQIGDMGTPMSADLLDGSLYFSSTDNASVITNWYKQQFTKLGYTAGGTGTTGRYGKVTSTFVSFSKAGQVGEPTLFPQIDLGVASGGSTTVFKLKVDYIALPIRPANTILPSDVVKVVLSGGNQSFTVTNQDWIRRVVQQINALGVTSPGITNCPSIGTPAGAKPKYQGPVQAQFALQDGKSIPVVFSLPCGVRDVTVNHSRISLQGTTKLDQEINTITGFVG